MKNGKLSEVLHPLGSQIPAHILYTYPFGHYVTHLPVESVSKLSLSKYLCG